MYFVSGAYEPARRSASVPILCRITLQNVPYMELIRTKIARVNKVMQAMQEGAR